MLTKQPNAHFNIVNSIINTIYLLIVLIVNSINSINNKNNNTNNKIIEIEKQYNLQIAEIYAIYLMPYFI